jgi:DHA1 family tetracycline resistance protein-like MFS transporter
MEPAVVPRKGAFAFIFATVTLDMLAFGVIAPVFPKLVINFVGGDNAQAAVIFGVFGTVFALMQFLMSPILGALSDRFGRRPVIILSNIGLGVDYIIMALAPNLAWLFVGRVLSGITSASATTAYAYVADVAPPEKRAAGFGLLGAAFGIGFIIGPAVGGLLGAVDPHYPFWFAAGLSLLNGVYGFFVLPESLPPALRRAFSWSRANPIGSLKMLRSHHELFGLASVSFLSVLAGAALPSIFVLYVIGRYAWDERAIGLSLALVGIFSILTQAVLVKPAIDRFGERLALYGGLFFGTAGMVVYGLAPTGLLLNLGTPILMLWGISASAAQAMMSRRVDATEQGELQGALGSLRGIASLAGPALFTFVYSQSVGRYRDAHLPGAAWFLAAALLFVSAIVAIRVTRRNASAAA